MCFATMNILGAVLLTIFFFLNFAFPRAKKLSSRFHKIQYLYIPFPVLDSMYILFKIYRGQLLSLIERCASINESGFMSWTFGSYNLIVVNDADVCHKLLSSIEPGHLAKPQKLLKELVPPNAHNGLVDAPYSTWISHRRLISKDFNIRAHVRAINVEQKRLISLLRGTAKFEEGGILKGSQLFEPMDQFVANVLMGLLIGDNDWNGEDTKKFVDLGHDLIRANIEDRLIRKSLHLLPKHKRLEIQSLNDFGNVFTSKVLKQIRKDVTNSNGKSPFSSLLQSLVQAKASDEEITPHISTFLGAGYGTLSVEQKIVLLFLGMHKELQVTCRKEVDSLLATKTDGEVELQWEELSKLEYLDRFIKESLRLIPPAPVFARELETPLMIDEDFAFRAGSIVCILPGVIHMNPRYYPNPKKFDPDRFLPEVAKERPPGTYLSFSGGTRNCIGQRVAMATLKIFLVGILSHFEVHADDEIAAVKMQFDLTLRPERDFNVWLKERDTLV